MMLKNANTKRLTRGGVRSFWKPLLEFPALFNCKQNTIARDRFVLSRMQ